MKKPTYYTSTLQRRAYYAMRERHIHCLKNHNIGPTDWSLLGILADNSEGVRQVDVAHLLGIKAPMVTVMVRELMERGLITQTESTKDRRVKLLLLTLEGTQFVEYVEAALSQEIQKIFSGLSQEEIDIYRKVLHTIIDNAEKAPFKHVH